MSGPETESSLSGDTESKAPEDQSNGDGSHQSWFVEIGKAKKAKRAGLIQSVERLCASQTARRKAVLDRLQDTFPTPQLPASLSPLPKSSPRGKKVKHTSNMKDKSGQTQDTKKICYEEDCMFQKKQLPGGQAAGQGDPLPNISNECGDVGETLSPVDAHTPRETRFSTDLGSWPSSILAPAPHPGPKPRRQSRLPVIIGKADKEASGCRLQSATSEKEPLPQRLQRHVDRSVLPQPLTSSKKMVIVAAQPAELVPTDRMGPLHDKTLSPPKSHIMAGKTRFPPLTDTSESAPPWFRQLSSHNWEKKMEGMKSVADLAQHHPEQLKTKLHAVCRVLTEEVKNQRPSLASAVIDTIAELHTQLGKSMDPEAERTSDALLLKLAQTNNEFVHQRANLALDALVKGCSPAKVLNVLLSTGLSHHCAAVRESAAQHIHQLKNITGEDYILKAGRRFSGGFLIAVSKMCADSNPEVRNHGQEMLWEFAQHKEFMVQWQKAVPAKARAQLVKLLKRMRRQKAQWTRTEVEICPADGPVEQG
ncbi:PREDICTED: protein STU1-like isoform X1 [Poecilia mexicana]|uniref:protein STU1-like isoform X1 n=1 Tax=Poecilia formosa TaxID=48698 RepID=UPI000443BB24|nr:PREDICTED: protein STU1-like isoform X1 [Poecilia formosa]XP_014855144.1 PREDICTED: protein STU1-like isoform X1 [Poecilia mexicana]